MTAQARTPQIAAWCAELGVAPDADAAVIKAAGKALLVAYHPDRGDGPADRAVREDRCRRVSEAVTELTDPRHYPLAVTVPAPPRPAPPAGTAGPVTSPHPWAGFDAATRKSVWDDAAATVLARERAAAAAARPRARTTNWGPFAVLACAAAWVAGAVRWLGPVEGRPSAWPWLLVGASVAAAVSAAVWATVHGPRRAWALVLFASAAVAAPAILAPAALAAVGAPWLRRRARTVDTSGWWPATVVTAVWVTVGGWALTGPALDPLWGCVPAAVAAPWWLLVNGLLRRCPARHRDLATTAAAVSVVVAPAGIVAVLAAAGALRVRARATT